MATIRRSLRGKTCNRQTNFFVEGGEKYGTRIFRATSSIVFAVSSFVAKGRQTMHHVFASPPFHPGRSDFPSPVGDLDHSHFFPMGPSQSHRNLIANPHTPLMRLVYPIARHQHVILPGLFRLIPLDAHQDREPLRSFRL